MSDVNSLSRMLSIRISTEEYHELRKFSDLSGARSLSDLARQAFHEILSHKPTPDLNLTELSHKVHLLDKEVTRLAKLVDKQ